MTEYRALHSEFGYSAEYRPGEPNIELYIGILNIVLNIELYIRLLNLVLNIDLESPECRALHSDVEALHSHV